MIAGATWDHLLGDPNYIARIASVTTTSALAVGVAWLRERREDQLRRMTVIADAAQRAVLPRVPVVARDLRFSARYRFATREALIGGDFYEVVVSEDRIRAILGDVRGKGVEAVQLAALVVLGFRRSAVAAATLVAVAEELDHVVRRDGRGEFLEIIDVAAALRTGDVERALDAVTEVARRHSRGRAAGDDTALLLVERVAQPADITAGLGSHLRA